MILGKGGCGGKAPTEKGGVGVKPPPKRGPGGKAPQFRKCLLIDLKKKRPNYNIFPIKCQNCQHCSKENTVLCDKGAQ